MSFLGLGLMGLDLLSDYFTYARGLLSYYIRVVVVVPPLCVNGGLQECGREEHGSSPTKALC